MPTAREYSAQWQDEKVESLSGSFSVRPNFFRADSSEQNCFTDYAENKPCWEMQSQQNLKTG